MTVRKEDTTDMCPTVFNRCIEKPRGYKGESLAGTVMAKDACKNLEKKLF